MTVEEDIATQIADNTAGVVLGTDVFTGPPRAFDLDNPSVPGAVPEQAIFCLGTGGIDDIPYVDGGDKNAQKRYTVQVTIRSNPEDYDGGKTLADAVFEAIDKNPPDTYEEVRALNSSPLYVREDEGNHHEWVINLLVRKCVFN